MNAGLDARLEAAINEIEDEAEAADAMDAVRIYQRFRNAGRVQREVAMQALIGTLDTVSPQTLVKAGLVERH